MQLEGVSPAPSKAPFGLKRIGWELERTALGDGYYGSALRAALDFAFLDAEQKAVLQRFLSYTQSPNDRDSLCAIGFAVYHHNESVADAAPVGEDGLKARMLRAKSLIHGAKLCASNSMSCQAEVFRLLDQAIEALSVRP